MWGRGGGQERLSEIVTPKYLAEGTDLVSMGHLVPVICRTWHLDGLKLMSHLFPHNSRVWRSDCKVFKEVCFTVSKNLLSSSRLCWSNWWGL